MEVRSESFNSSAVQKPPVSSPQGLQNVRMTFGPDGSTIYRPVVSTAAVAGSGDGTQPAVEPVKRKRGRPRKYAPDGAMSAGRTAVASTPRPVTSPPAGVGVSGAQGPVVVTPISVAGLTEGEEKKARGRPAGSGKKMQMDALGSAGIGFTPHVITVKAGEGRFEILSLSGSFLLSDNDGQRSRTGGMSVSLAGPDGRVLGGGVAGLLTAASPVQVVVGSFIPDGHGQKELTPMSNADPSAGHEKFSPSGMAGSPRPLSRATMSESPGGPGSPFNHSNNGNQHGMSGTPWR